MAALPLKTTIIIIKVEGQVIGPHQLTVMAIMAIIMEAIIKTTRMR